MKFGINEWTLIYVHIATAVQTVQTDSPDRVLSREAAAQASSHCSNGESQLSFA